MAPCKAPLQSLTNPKIFPTLHRLQAINVADLPHHHHNGVEPDATLLEVRITPLRINAQTGYRNRAAELPCFLGPGTGYLLEWRHVACSVNAAFNSSSPLVLCLP